MGCAASSVNIVPVEEAPTIVYNIVVVDKFQGGKIGEDRLPLVDVYSSDCFSLKYSLVRSAQMDEKLQTEFSALPHATKPDLYIIEKGKDGKVWQATFSGEERKHISLPTFPEIDKHIFSCSCCFGKQTLLYVFLSDCSCYCLDIDQLSSGWQLTQNLPIDVHDVTAVYTVENNVAFLTDTFELVCFQPPNSPTEPIWHQIFREPVPPGIFGIVDKYLYCLSEEESALFRIDLTNADFSRVMLADVDVDIEVLQKSTSMTGAQDVLYFSGYHYSAEKITIMEVDIVKKRCVVVGYLDYISPDHQIVLLPSESDD